MASTHTPALERLISTVSPIVTMERDGLVVIALGATADTAVPPYLTLDEATRAKAVDVHELGGGTVPTVAVETRDRPVVIFGGDTIVGGKQNRIVNVTIWLAAMQTTKIPVTCLEHGRWDHGAETRFASGPKADLGLRSMMNRQVHARARAMATVDASMPAEARYAADQGRVWDEVERRHERAGTSSRTGALHDLYAREAVDMAALLGAFPYPEDAVGAAIAIGGRLVALELYDAPATSCKLWPRLIEGAVRAHLDHRRSVATGAAPAPRHRYPDREALGRMLGRVRLAQADALESPAVGEGTDVRFATDRISGAVLVRQGRVVHAEVHRIHG
jgi:hypothetical protein